MIIIDVEVPILGRVYDFKVNPKDKAGTVAEEMVRRIKEKEEGRQYKEEENFLLCLPETQEILNPAESLLSYAITDGTRLLLL